MNMNYFLINAAILATGGSITVIVFWLLVRTELQNYLKVARDQQTGNGKKEQNELLNLRLQAYERMVIFIERLDPSNLFIRLYEPGMMAKTLHTHILQEIRSEYQHNTTQQLYVNSETWNIISKLKEDTIAMINNAAASLAAETSGAELSKKVLEHLAGIKENPYELTREFIRKDIHRLF